MMMKLSTPFSMCVGLSISFRGGNDGGGGGGSGCGK